MLGSLSLSLFFTLFHQLSSFFHFTEDMKKHWAVEAAVGIHKEEDWCFNFSKYKYANSPCLETTEMTWSSEKSILYSWVVYNVGHKAEGISTSGTKTGAGRTEGFHQLQQELNSYGPY